jgi:uncharacterized membrane protein HdeD (DUF308 family)
LQLERSLNNSTLRQVSGALGLLFGLVLVASSLFGRGANTGIGLIAGLSLIMTGAALILGLGKQS